MNAEQPSDFQAWLTRTARLLREHRWDELDAEQLADEVEDLGKSERRSITCAVAPHRMQSWAEMPRASLDLDGQGPCSTESICRG